MRSFAAFLKGRDAFGERVSINYDGEGTYNTAWGAILTLAQWIFILVVATLGVIDLVNFEDPTITQYKIYDKRQDDQEINFGENYGGFLIGL